jgi:hypothetical protein
MGPPPGSMTGLIGAGIGAMVGAAALGVLAHEPCVRTPGPLGNLDCLNSAGQTMGAAISGLFVGGMLGAVIGHAMGGRWVRVPPAAHAAAHAGSGPGRPEEAVIRE